MSRFEKGAMALLNLPQPCGRKAAELRTPGILPVLTGAIFRVCGLDFGEAAPFLSSPTIHVAGAIVAVLIYSLCFMDFFA